MAKLFTLQFLSGLVLVSSAAALCVAPACTTSSGSDSPEGGAGGEGNQGGATPSTGGMTSRGGSGGAPAGGAPAGGADGEGGTTGDAGGPAGGSAGDAVGGSAGDAGAGGAGGAAGKVCTNPLPAEVSATGDSCADYCSAYLSTCATFNTSDGTFANAAACLSACEFFGDNQLCCRAYHVRNAAASASAATTHCPHAGGDGVVCN